MKKLSIIFITIMLLGASILSAHPASDMNAEYNKETQILTVSFDHKVKDPGDHFIYDVEVKLNKKKIIEQEVSFQENDKGGSFIYKVIDAGVGDVFDITIGCNKWGKKKVKLVIE